MEDLNNRQIVLLTMLVSFVVSIATGIITVAMLEEAPQTLTQTVNRVVERTIERVVTGTSTPEKTAPITTVTKEVTVYTKEDDLIISAVEKNQPRIAKIFPRVLEGASTSSLPIAIGFVVSRDGLIVTDRAGFTGTPNPQHRYPITLNGKDYVALPVELKGADGEQLLFFLKISGLREGETVDAVSFGRAEDPKIAQTVIILSGLDGLGIFKASLAKFQYNNPAATSTPPSVIRIETSPRIPNDSSGGLVLNLDGQAAGIVVAGDETARAYIYPASRILELVGAAPKASPAQSSEA